MAEIKSTLDMVLARAARIAAESDAQEDSGEDTVKEGMRLAAAYLSQPGGDLTASLAGQSVARQAALRRGMAQTLLRNIVLPRDEMLKERGELAIKGIVDLLAATGGVAVTTACAEMRQLLGQYGKHKEQMTQQLEDALLRQLEQQYTARSVQPPARLTAAMHPKYKDELARLLLDLNDQYGQAMDQRKEILAGLAAR
ncbi:MAG: hypothetical protein LBH14_05390 [Desulfobulbaceae bacterium]|jgi:hypothetical protein|nr:hypothetical protein [Desulfobulbaceae bacterium]